jgi:hypothetical protein
MGIYYVTAEMVEAALAAIGLQDQVSASLLYEALEKDASTRLRENTVGVRVPLTVYNSPKIVNWSSEPRNCGAFPLFFFCQVFNLHRNT